MITRRDFIKVIAVTGATVAAGVGPQAATTVMAQAPTPPYLKKGRITFADKRAAARAARERGLRPGAAPRLSRAAAPGPGGVPDYFGPYPNWALSPRLRKFVDSLPGLGTSGANNRGVYIPVATPVTSQGADYYEIELAKYYTHSFHSDLPATPLEGYRQTNTGDTNHGYLGPVIIAHRNTPVRVKFTNKLGLSTGGSMTTNDKLFIPVDETIMGAGMGPNGGNYTQNRACLHLHGGNSPWVSDGTAHQWKVAQGEPSPYKKGGSLGYVPDMPTPTDSDGVITYYWTNQQSGRLMFYHDHAVGITRLNVYQGQAAGYLLVDPQEDALITQGVLPNLGGLYTYGIPLVIQDKTFVDASTMAQRDPTWNWGSTPGTHRTGDLWFPHVYMPNQNPYVETGANAMGRWDYGPWFWPPYTGLANQPVPNEYYDPNNAPWEPPVRPATPNPSLVPEAFMDTPIVNGQAYPYLPVQQRAYRFRILNACNDRFLNLQIYYAKSNGTMWSGTTLLDGDAGEVSMVPADPNTGLPPTWPTDGRAGGVPDPHAAGPAMIQIGSEGGFLPEPAVLPNTPIGYNYDRRSIVVLNVANKTLFLGPAERADVIVDFSGCPAGSKLILYNDAPAPVPAFDPRIDYYTGAPDMQDVGGAPTPQPGYGPNTRTIMQFQVMGGIPNPTPFDLAALQRAWPAAYKAAQHEPLVPQAPYNRAFGANYPSNNYARIADNFITFTPAGGNAPVTLPLLSKAIQELFEPEYGRMNAILGVELPFTNIQNQTTIPYYFIDPPTEIVQPTAAGTIVGAPGDNTQIWKITHNGVDTHAIHFHMVDVQVLNRVGWDGMIGPPDPNELGWKDTVRMNPLEDIIVALRPIAQTLPANWRLPNSVRLLNPAEAAGSTLGFTNVDPQGQPVTVTNHLVNFGYEYVWHCHLLGHEENDMMRAVCLAVAPQAPTNLTASAPSIGHMTLSWRKNSANETHWTIQRSLANGGPFTTVAQIVTPPGLAVGAAVTYDDTTVARTTAYWYRIIANNIVGDTTNYAPAPGYPSVSADSAPSNVSGATSK